MAPMRVLAVLTSAMMMSRWASASSALLWILFLMDWVSSWNCCLVQKRLAWTSRLGEAGRLDLAWLGGEDGRVAWVDAWIVVSCCWRVLAWSVRVRAAWVRSAGLVRAASSLVSRDAMGSRATVRVDVT